MKATLRVLAAALVSAAFLCAAAPGARGYDDPAVKLVLPSKEDKSTPQEPYVTVSPFGDRSKLAVEDQRPETKPKSSYDAGSAPVAPDYSRAVRVAQIPKDRQFELGEVARPAPRIDLSPQFSDRLPYSMALGRVVCESNFPPESVAGLDAEIIQLQKDLVGFLGVPEANEKIELCLFKDMASYREFIAATFPGAPTNRPALYVKDKGPGVLMVPKDPNLIVNIRHEMTHAYLNASLKNVPIWIDEGLAKYFEVPPGERGFRNPYLEKTESDAASLFASPPSLARLEKLRTVDQMKTREYRESWSWVHYMLHYSPRTHRLLAIYLQTLRPENQRGISMKDSFELQKKTPLKQSLEKFEPKYKREYVEHFKNWDRRRADYENGRFGTPERAELGQSRESAGADLSTESERPL